jgi:hypothetical protein
MVLISLIIFHKILIHSKNISHNSLGNEGVTLLAYGI